MIMCFPISNLLTYCSLLIFSTGRENIFNIEFKDHHLILGSFVDSVKLPSRTVKEHEKPYLLSNNLQYQEPKVGLDNSEFV